MKKYLLQYKLEVDSWERVVRTVSDIKASTGMEPVSVVGNESGITRLPRFEKDLPADSDMRDGEWYWEFNTNFSASELEVFGPFVRPDHLASLNWHSVKWVGKCKDGKITKKYSTDTYPIFMIECTYEVDGEERKFYKKYEPMVFDKQYSFMYIGLKPRNYIYGFSELKAAYTKFNEERRSEWESDPLNEGKPYKEKKLWNVEICLDERDAVLACSRGTHPLWMNSEIAFFEDSHLAELSRFAETVYIKWPRP